ncbi:MAG: type IV secretion protein Dot [Legionellaceae bacterium]|nr:type IV secretion protein Dot [Legionellaceae bacterium]
MDTLEHVVLGNSLRIQTFDNPLLSVDEQGQLRINLHRLDAANLPRSVPQLWLTPGEIIAMVDYFTEKNWDMVLDLPRCPSYEDSVRLGRDLIRRPPFAHEERALYQAYQNLAADDVKPKDIARIFSITSANYIPFSKTLNSYAQLLMLFLRVKDYGEMLNRNQTHFTPWAVRCYILGHHQALQYARFSWYLRQLSEDRHFLPPDALCADLGERLQAPGCDFSPQSLRQRAQQFHALSLGIECYTFHYYSDHFATGHMSQVGNLRKALPERFGVWGGILANNMHDEINRVGALTTRPYDPTPNPQEPPLPARGDGAFNSCLNAYNKDACIAGMQHSLADIEQALSTGRIAEQTCYGGLEHLADVDYQYRQHQPLFIMREERIYQRGHLDKIRLLSPADYQRMLADPGAYGYQQLKTKWQAFKLVAKLRLLPFLYKGKVQAISEEYRHEIEADEAARNPGREPVPAPPCPLRRQQPVAVHASRPQEPRPLHLGANSLFAPANQQSETSSTEKNAETGLLASL